MLKFVDGSEVQVGAIVAVIYGAPNVGKTSLALTASKPALLDFDGGAYRAGNKAGKSILPVRSWGDIAQMSEADFKAYDTLVVDTVGTCLDLLAADIIRLEPKNGRAGALTLQGYGVLKSRFKGWLDAIRSYGVDVVLVAHASEEQRGDDCVDRIIASGSSKQEIYQQADLMGRLAIHGKDRILSFDPTATSFGKNVGLPDFTIKPPELNPALLAEIIKDAKEMINNSAEAGQSEHDRLVELREVLEKLPASVKVFNGNLKSMIEYDAPPADRKMLVDVGIEKGFKFNRTKKHFEEAEVKKEEKKEAGAPF